MVFPLKINLSPQARQQADMEKQVRGRTDGKETDQASFLLEETVDAGLVARGAAVYNSWSGPRLRNGQVRTKV
jgi:hypothetical protein